MLVYRLHIRPERAPDVWRVLEFSARHTLDDVHQAIAEGDELALALSFIDPAQFLSDRALLLAEAGERDAALSQVKENLKSFGDDHPLAALAGRARGAST